MVGELFNLGKDVTSIMISRTLSVAEREMNKGYLNSLQFGFQLVLCNILSRVP